MLYNPQRDTKNGGRLIVGCALACVVLGSAPARGTVVFDESLGDGSCDASACYASSGGNYVGAGWRVTGPASQLVFELADPNSAGIACGSVTVEFTNFDPLTNLEGCGSLSECATHFIALYEGDHGNMHTASGQDESQLMVQATCEGMFRDERLLYKGLACSWDHNMCYMNPDHHFLPPQLGNGIDWTNTVGHHYTVTISWDCQGVTHALSDDHGHSWNSYSTWDWHGAHPDPRPHLRYLFLGQDDTTGFGNMRVRLTEFVRVTVEQDDATCNCTTNTPPTINAIRVFAADDTRLDGGGPAATAGDTVFLRGDIEDAETADVDMQNCRFSLRTHGAASWDVFADTAATFSPFTPDPDLNWMVEWNIPSNATAGLYDVRFACTDEGGLSVSQTQNNEFEVVVSTPPDAGLDSTTPPVDGASVDPDGAIEAGTDGTPDTAVDASSAVDAGVLTDAGPMVDGNEAPKDRSVNGGCNCTLGAGRPASSNPATLPVFVFFFIFSLFIFLALHFYKEDRP
jgi:hypothetical protein